MNRLLALGPEVVLALTGLATVPLLVSRRDRSRAARAIGLGGGAVLVVACAASLRSVLDALWLAYSVEPFAQAVKLAVALSFVLACACGIRGAARALLCLLGGTMGLIVMASAVEGLALLLALETAALSLGALPQASTRPGVSGVAGLAASACSFIGLAMLAGLTGTTQLDRMETLLPALAGEPAAAAAVALFLSGFVVKPALLVVQGVRDRRLGGARAFLATAPAIVAALVLHRLLAIVHPLQGG